METYLVGGAVRDRLLGRRVNERDWVVVGATPGEMRKRGFRSVGRDFPVFLHPDTNEEYALARTERKTGRGYHGFEFHAEPDVTLEQDLARRDLTVNAMAEDESGRIIDPFDGQTDLQARTLRHVSDAFVEDPVRILRVARFGARFASLGFGVAEETLALMRRMVDNGEVDHLVAERVWQETRRALDEETPSVFFRLLRDCGALARIFPEVDRLFGVPQPEKHHPEIDTGVHTLMVVDMAARLSHDNSVRFAALVHDLGKGVTPADALPGHKGHEEAGVPVIRELCERLRTPKDYRELAEVVSRYHLLCHKARELRPGTVLKVLEGVDAFRKPERFERFLVTCEADARGRKGFEERDYPQPEVLRRAYEVASKIGGKDVDTEGLAGPEIKEAIRNARVQAIADGIS